MDIDDGQIEVLLEHFGLNAEEGKFLINQYMKLNKLTIKEIKIFAEIDKKLKPGVAEGAFCSFLFYVTQELNIGKSFYISSLLSRIMFEHNVSPIEAIAIAKKEMDKQFPSSFKGDVSYR